MNDYYVRQIDLPLTVKGMTTPNDDGTFSVYINARLADQEKKKALDHELKHINNDDFYREEPVADKERRCG